MRLWSVGRTDLTTGLCSVTVEVADSLLRGLCMGDCCFLHLLPPLACLRPAFFPLCEVLYPLRSAQPCPMALCDSVVMLGCLWQMGLDSSRDSFRQAKRTSGRSIAVRQEGPTETPGSYSRAQHGVRKGLRLVAGSSLRIPPHSLPWQPARSTLFASCLSDPQTHAC